MKAMQKTRVLGSDNVVDDEIKYFPNTTLTPCQHTITHSRLNKEPVPEEKPFQRNHNDTMSAHALALRICESCRTPMLSVEETDLSHHNDTDADEDAEDEYVCYQCASESAVVDAAVAHNTTTPRGD